MAYFLPSYFQKRLLRYALGRLDFIESSALDLDNLDLTIGQRSVIELKNVGIRVDKLVDRLALPPTVLPKNATVQRLRIVVPADLHASGIEIEIDGIDIAVELKETASEQTKSSRRRSSQHDRGPSHTDVVNRPRSAISSLHDPGGDHSDHIIPRPQDLAESFLGAEPEHERQELEAVVQSQSIRLQRSRVQLDRTVSEDDTGLAEGFSLPGFVTNFLAGIADRLSVSLKHITISATLLADRAEYLQLVLKIKQFDLNASEQYSNAAESARKVRINGIEVLVVTDQDSLSTKSRPSSPKLTRSRYVASSTSQRAQSLEPGRPSQGSHFGPTSSNSSSASSFHSNEGGIGPGDSMLGSQIFSSTIHRTRTSSPVEEGSSLPAAQTLPDGTPLTPARSSTSSSTHSSQETHSMALAESMIYSHAEAQSMYMSAMSTARMPGAFEDAIEEEAFVAVRQSPVTEDPATSNVKISDEYQLGPVERVTTPAPGPPDIDREQASVDFEVSASDCVKRLIKIKEAVFEIPTLNNALDDMQSSLVTTPVSIPPSPGSTRRSLDHSNKSIRAHAHSLSDQSVYGGIPQDQRRIQFDDSTTTKVQIRDIEVFLDIVMCGILLKAGSRTAKLLAPQEDDLPSRKAKTKLNPTDRTMRAGISSLVVHLMDNVPDISKSPSSQILAKSTSSTLSQIREESMLQLQILDMEYHLSRSEILDNQKLTIRKVGLYQNSTKYVSFFEPSRLQDSFVSPSIVAEPHDLILQLANERVEINIKPMHVMLDLLVIDEVLSRSGGLSSLLDLGSSVTSTDTVKGQAEQVSNRRRSVHFVDPNNAASTVSDAGAGLKINVRLAGTLIELVGSESSVQVKTSVVKIIHRTSGLKLSIASTTIEGPLMQNSPFMMPLTLKIRGLSLEFRDKPYDHDLDRLLSLLVPSSDKYEDDDDIMVDTLLRQRRKGSLLQLNIDNVQFSANTLVWLPRLVNIVDEISKLSSVAKYLPEDDKPGLLSFVLVKNMDLSFQLSDSHEPLNLNVKLLEAAHITFPALMAVQLSTITLKIGLKDPVIHALLPNIQEQSLTSAPMIMCRFIPNEMEPTVKLKIANMVLEYSVPLLLSITRLFEDAQTALNTHPPGSPVASEVSRTSTDSSETARRIKLSIGLRNSGVLLKPLGLKSAGLCLLTDTTFVQSMKSHGLTASLALNKASIMITDDLEKTSGTHGSEDAKLYFDQNDTVQELVRIGYVPVGTFSGAKGDLAVNKSIASGEQFIDVEFKNSLLYLETCADSTQTLIQVLGGLSPPSAPLRQEKFRTQIVPLEDMLASFTGNPIVSEPGPQLGMSVVEGDQSSLPPQHLGQPSTSENVGEDLSASMFEDEMFDVEPLEDHEYRADTSEESGELSKSTESGLGGVSVHIAPVNPIADKGITTGSSVMMHSLIDLRQNHFSEKSSVGGTAHRWDAAENTYGMSSERSAKDSPMKVRIRDVHIIWNLFDGYDWANTRDVISQAVRDVEEKAFAKQQRRMNRRAASMEDDDESVIGDVLFNSIYISIPNKGDPRDLATAINMELGDAASETASQTGSYATSTTITATPNRRHSTPRPKSKKLRLRRSKQHKMTFELEGLALDFLAFQQNSGGVESSVDIRVHKLDIFDHVPTSTWRKFATYMHESGEREVGTDQVHIELLNVKPVEELVASEIIMKMTVLPLRLHVDQDALDFLTRFFEFKDDSIEPSSTHSSPPFIQRVEVNPIKVRLDFKPKRVDYGGLKSGRTTELMNFFILERADLVLRRVILYGVSGFDRMGIMLNSIWTPDVRNNQLPTVLAGLTPVRSLVDVGSGVRDLVAIPIREYRKDGRIVRSIQKGAMAFAKTTTTELVNLGAKLAIGTQTVLQTAEDVLGPQRKTQHKHVGDASDSSDDERPHVVSHYADQPVGIVQGLRGAYASLERDLLLARDAVVAVPGEIMAEGSATGAAKVVLKNSPTIILRPAIGVTKAVGTALLGAGNSLDKGNRRRVEDKYKSR